MKKTKMTGYFCGPDPRDWEAQFEYHRNIKDVKKYCDDYKTHGIGEIEIRFIRWIRKPKVTL